MDINLFRNLPYELIKKITIFASPTHPTAKIISELQTAKKNKRELCYLYRRETKFAFILMRKRFRVSQSVIFDGMRLIGRLPAVAMI